MYQTWRDLLFVHWAYDPAVIQATLPDRLTVDTWDGKAYVGIVPFFMRRIRPPYVPPIPGVSWFLETNVRTYVIDETGTAGVWFYSLDANQWLAILVARLFFRLPYFRAWMRAKKQKNSVAYRTRRWRAAQETRIDYAGVGEMRPAEPSTFEFWLIERYILFAQTWRGLRLGKVWHEPYDITTDVSWEAQHLTTLLTLNHLPDPERPPDHVCYSPGVSVNVFPLTKKV